MYPNDTRVAINEYLIDKIMTPQVEALKESYYLPKYDQFIKQLEGCMKKDGFSVTWSMGGTYGSYTGSIHETSGELEPPFSALDEFLLENFPNMGFLQYKYLEGKIQRYTDDERDYYGGSVTHGYKKLLFSDLSDCLVKFNYIEPGQVFYEKEINEYIKTKYTKEWFEAEFPQPKPKTNKKIK